MEIKVGYKYYFSNRLKDMNKPDTVISLDRLNGRVKIKYFTIIDNLTGEGQWNQTEIEVSEILERTKLYGRPKTWYIEYCK